MRKLLFTVLVSCFSMFATCIAEECPCYLDFNCDSSIPLSRADHIPQTHVVGVSDRYLSGYIQALIDMHYYEFQVRVVVINHLAYVFNLPANDLVAGSILCFIADVPCIDCVERVECGIEEFLRSMARDCPDEEELQSITSICEMPLPSCRVRGIWFPQSSVLFAPLVADPRQVNYSAALRFNDDVIGKHVGAANFGDEFPIYRWKRVLRWCGDMQIGIEAGVFSVFDLDNPDACMVNTDFFVGIPLTYAINQWSYRLRIWHLSSHLGDEFLICNPGYDRRNRSEEGIDFFASYQLNPAIRLYAGVGGLIDTDTSFHEKPLYIEYGTEIRVFGCRHCYQHLYVQPFFAMNFLNWQERDWSLDATYALGVEYSKIQGVGKKFRIFLQYHDGFSEEGQFVKLRANYFSIRTSYSF